MKAPGQRYFTHTSVPREGAQSCPGSSLGQTESWKCAALVGTRIPKGKQSLGMCLSRSSDHAQGHPPMSIPWIDERTNHGESCILPTTSAVGISPPSPNTFHFPAFTPTIFQGENKAGPPCALPQLAGSIQGLKAGGMPQQDGKERILNHRQTPACCSSPAIEGIQTLLLVEHLQLLTTVPGLGALQGSCLLMHQRGTARRHLSAP